MEMILFYCVIELSRYVPVRVKHQYNTGRVRPSEGMKREDAPFLARIQFY